MIWTTWRQHRAEAGVGAFILAALTAAMLVVGSTARDRAHALGLPRCTDAGGDCANALEALHRDFHTIPPFTAALIAVPLLAGMFWAAPLVSREYEAGTHRLAWTQSVSPLRWITVKIILIFAVLAAAAAGLGLLATWTLDPLTPAFGGRYNSTWYDTQAIVPVACMLFALAVGVAASALIRRTVPAMALTLVAYAAARMPIHVIRAHFAPLSTRTDSVSLSSLVQQLSGTGTHEAPVIFQPPTMAPGDWLQSVTVTDPSGHPIANRLSSVTALQQHYCSTLPSRTACQSALQHLYLHEKIRYQLASRFWLVQAVESALFLGLAALLVTVALYAVARHRPT